MSPKMSEQSAGLPGMSNDLRRTYEGVVRAGATGPASACDAKLLSKKMRMSRHELEDDLRALEGKGVIGHQSSHGQTTWYARRT